MKFKEMLNEKLNSEDLTGILLSKLARLDISVD